MAQGENRCDFFSVGVVLVRAGEAVNVCYLRAYAFYATRRQIICKPNNQTIANTDYFGAIRYSREPEMPIGSAVSEFH